jgi:hypothetical protein
MRCARFIAALAASLATLPASATVRIAGDNGGQIGPYLNRFEAMRKSGERVVIDGPCLSACTMVLGAIPRNRICVTARARLGFHAAYDRDQNGGEVTNRGGTSLLMEHYPQEVRNWIVRRGGLSRQMIYLSGSELSSIYASCDSLAGEHSRDTTTSRGLDGAAPDLAQTPRADTWRRQKGGQPSGRSAAKAIHY